eukprot:Hpha_TRINITY_DN19161_c0_g1::TRINITY_DN19161_c0_g1_i1::g.94736::m.94736
MPISGGRLLRVTTGRRRARSRDVRRASLLRRRSPVSPQSIHPDRLASKPVQKVGIHADRTGPVPVQRFAASPDPARHERPMSFEALVPSGRSIGSPVIMEQKVHARLERMRLRPERHNPLRNTVAREVGRLEDLVDELLLIDRNAPDAQQRVWEELDKVWAFNPLSPRQISSLLMMIGDVERPNSPVHKWRMAFDILQYTREKQPRDLGADTLMHTSNALRCATRALAWEAALRLYDKERNIRPTGSKLRGNIVISGCDKAAAWEQGLKVAGLMIADDEPLSDRDFTVIMSTCATGHRWQDCLGFLAASEGHCIHYGAAIHACQKAFAIMPALETWERRAQTGVPDYPSVGRSVAMALSRASYWEEALSFLPEPTGNREILLNDGMTAKIYQKGNEWEKALGYLQRMRGEGREPNTVVLNTAVQACAAQSLWHLTAALLVQAQQSEFRAARSRSIVLHTDGRYL